MKYHISHQIYAATRKNGGFGVFYQSPTLSQLEDSNREIIKKNSTYSAPVAIPNGTDLSLFPINFAYYIIEDNGTRKTALLFSRYTGATNHTPDRQGNFLSHTIVFEDYLEKICIAEILKQLPFQKSLTIEEETIFVPPIEEIEYDLHDSSSCIQENVNFLISDPKYQNTLLAIIDEIIDGWLNTKGHNITINSTTNDECINLIYALYSLIPAYLINKYSFTTYTYNPNKISYQICGIIPECKVMELDPEYFKMFDVEKYVEDYSPKWELTRFLKTWLLEHDIEKIGCLGQLFADYNIEELDERVEMPFRIEDFKENISTKQIADLNGILQLFPSTLSIPKDKLIEYVKNNNLDLYLSYQTQEMRKEVKMNHSITSCVNVIEKYIKMLGSYLNDEQLLLFYKEYEQAVSQLARPGQIAAELLTNNYQDVRAICLNNKSLQDYLFNSVEINWNDIRNKEAFLRENEGVLNNYKFPKIKLWKEKQTLENDIKRGSFFDNIESYEDTLSKYKEKDLVEIFSKSLEVKNEKGELSFAFLNKTIGLINSHFADPSIFWNNFFLSEIEKVSKDYRIPYSNKWSYSLIKRFVIVHVAISDNRSLSNYEGLFGDFDEYECRWILERLSEIHNKEGYNTLLSLLPREKKKIFGFI
jgi:hypothetical protein